MSRLRVRSRGLPIVDTYHCYSRVSCSSPPLLCWSRTGDGLNYSRIHDTTNDSRPYKDVFHESVDWPVQNDGCIIDGAFHNWPAIELRDLAEIPSANDILFLVDLESPSFSRNAYKTITDAIPTIWDAASFVRELGEIASLFSINLLKKLFTAKSGMYDTKDLSGDYLNYSFGWAPTVSDLSRVVKLIERAKKLIDQFLAYNNQTLTGRYAEEGSFVHTNTTLSRVVETTINWRRNATARYRYILESKYANDALSRAAVLLNLFGFGDVRRFTWNAIPFSFVIDWFINAGDYLAQFDKDTIPYATEVDAYCESYTVTSVSTVSFQRYGGVKNSIGIRRSHIYYRRVMMPDTRDIPLQPDGSLNWRHYTLGAALLRNLV